MSEHSVFAFSASPRWIPCPGSMAYPENTAEGVDAGVYADEGSAAHLLASWVMKAPKGGLSRCEAYVGKKIKIGKREFEVTEEFADHVQTYVDDVERRSLGGYLMVEQRVTLEGIEGFDETNYGTSDAIMALPARRITAYKTPIADFQVAHGVVEDLKFGMGERVHAYTPAHKDSPFTMTIHVGDEAVEVEPNYQLMLYGLAALADILMLIDDPKFILLVINQPRLSHISELRVPIAVLERFAVFAADALKRSMLAMAGGVEAAEKSKDLLNPGEKQCRWCRALSRCPAAAKKAQSDVGADFENISETPPVVVASPKALAKAMLAVPFVAEWCRAVMTKAAEKVAEGVEIIGPDKKPYKLVEGKKGDRAWADEAAAEAALLGQLDAERAYAPRKLLTASAASKILDKKKTAKIWEDVFVPLIKRAPGKPLLVTGSDPRPPYEAASKEGEFEDLSTEE